MRLEHNLNAEEVKKENKGKPESRKLSKFKDIIEENAKYLKNAVRYSLIAASLVFTVKCGSPSDKPDNDADAGDSYEDVMDGVDTHDDELVDTHDDELLDTIEESDVPLDETEADTIDEDVEDEELPPLECEEPVEHACPATNTDFQAVVTDIDAVIDGAGTADVESYYSLDPSGTYELCPAGDGGYELVCVGDSRDFEEQHCYSADNIDATVEPASSETDICPAPGTEYPIIAGASESMAGVVYDFGGFTVDSVAGYTFEDMGAYFNVHNVGADTTYDVATLSLTPSSAGTYVISNMMDADTAGMVIRSVDGRGSELVSGFDIVLSGGSSKPFYLVAIGSGDRAHYDVDVQAAYGGGGAFLTTCFRCSGTGGNHYDLTIPLGDVICASDDEASACGCLGLPTDISIENIYMFNVEPLHLRDRVTIGTPILDISVVDSGTAVPSVIIPYDYTRGSPFDNPVSSTIFFDIVLEGTGHVCSGVVPFNKVYEVEVYTRDPSGLDYSACSCTFEG